MNLSDDEMCSDLLYLTGLCPPWTYAGLSYSCMRKFRDLILEPFLQQLNLPLHYSIHNSQDVLGASAFSELPRSVPRVWQWQVKILWDSTSCHPRAAHVATKEIAPGEMVVLDPLYLPVGICAGVR